MINEWLKKNSLTIADNLIKINHNNINGELTGGFGMKSRVVNFISLIRTAMYPNIYHQGINYQEFLHTIVCDNLHRSAMLLFEMCCDVLKSSSGSENCDVKRQAEQVTVVFMNSLDEIATVLDTDIQAAYDGDPAARTKEEIQVAYPAFEAISIFRLAHKLFELNVPLLPRIMTEYAHQITGIDIHPGATIGRYFFIDHGTGVVIGETCVIGEHVKLYQGVTLGAKSFVNDQYGNPVKGIKRHPNIGNNVVIYAGATILGGDTYIGDNSIIGGNVWLTSSVEAGSRVYNQLQVTKK